MNFIKQIVIAAICVVVLFSCNPDEKVKKQTEPEDLKVSIYTRSGGSGQRIATSANEVIFKLETTSTARTDAPQEMYFKNYIATDNGVGFDAVAGDGVYTVNYRIETTVSGAINQTKLDPTKPIIQRVPIGPDPTNPTPKTIRKAVPLFSQYGSNPKTNPTNPDFVKISCQKFYIIKANASCYGDVCPPKSLLGGTTWFCLCAGECSVEISF
jgi:hypothetical protein